MARHIILAQSECTAAALGAWVELIGEKRTEGDTLIAEGEKLDIFERAAEFIGRALGETGRTIVLVDCVNLPALNPCASSGWDAAVAMLILAFPEVRWIFGVLPGHPQQDYGCVRLEKLHGLASLFQKPFDPLFDATGLRQWVRSRAVKGPNQPALLKYAKRARLACALDDEEAYTYFHAYTAYRFGFQAIPVVREDLACSLLAETTSADAQGGWHTLKMADGLTLSFEDVFLNYPDRVEGEGWSDLEKRDQRLSALRTQNVLRVFVTTGQARGTDREKRKANDLHRQCLKQTGQLGSLVHKPIAGIFDLWNESRLRRKFRRNHGYEPDFDWPPKYSPKNESEDAHSAPGSLLLIAKHLIDRSEAALGAVQSVNHAVRGAVFATDALELLEGKTPTTALEALALKHQFEVMAECQFYGVQSHFEVSERIREIGRELVPIGSYFQGRNRRCAIWNAEAMILGNLISIFDDNQQFDESLILQARARRVHRRLWFNRVFKAFGDELRWLNPFYWVAAYTHGLLRSIPSFIGLLLIWVIGLGLLFGAVHPNEAAPNRARMGFENAITSFFSVGGPLQEEPAPAPGASGQPTPKPPAEWSPSYAGLICLSIVAGFFHLGIFISHVYSIASRK